MKKEQKNENQEEQKEKGQDEVREEKEPTTIKPSSEISSSQVSSNKAEDSKATTTPPQPEPKVAEKVKDKKVEIPEKFKKLVEEIEKMSVMDLAELVKILEEKFGVSATAVAVSTVSGGAGAGSEAAKEEKTSFNVELKNAGSQKIQVIKVVRELTGKGLKEAKDLVEGAPKILKENIKKEEAEEIKKKLEAAGATVELK